MGFTQGLSEIEYLTSLVVSNLISLLPWAPISTQTSMHVSFYMVSSSSSWGYPFIAGWFISIYFREDPNLKWSHSGYPYDSGNLHKVRPPVWNSLGLLHISHNTLRQRLHVFLVDDLSGDGDGDGHVNLGYCLIKLYIMIMLYHVLSWSCYILSYHDYVVSSYIMLYHVTSPDKKQKK